MDLKTVVPHVFKVNPSAVKPVTMTPDSSGAPVMLVPVPGEPGKPGPPGPAFDGTAWWYGEGSPTTVIGSKPGDFYVDTTTGEVYKLGD